MRSLGRTVLAVCSALGLALTTSGCLSDDTSLSPPSSNLDASFPDAGFNALDASGSVSPDAGTDAADAASPPVADAGHEAGITQLSLVAGSTLSRSPNYQLSGTSGPGTAPVQKSPNYKLVGGMTVSTQTP